MQNGTRYPVFELKDVDGRTVSSSDLAQRWFLLYWYPMAETPGCIAQATSLRNQIRAFDTLDCVVIGASFDLPEVNAAFKSKHQLPFRVLSDATRELALAVGAVDDSEAATPKRIAHLVTPGGIVARRYVVESPGMFAEDVLDDLEALAG